MPVDCIHPRKDEPEFAQTTRREDPPGTTASTAAPAFPACPVAAIYESIDAFPPISASIKMPSRTHQPTKLPRRGGISAAVTATAGAAITRPNSPSSFAVAPSLRTLRTRASNEARSCA